MLRSMLLTFLLAASLSAFGQNKAQDDQVPSTAGTPPAQGIQGQNIFDVKPEVKPDASSAPDYLKQNNGQRNKVQPGNNAPMWRGVAAGVEGYSSLPKSEAPEAGILIQGPVQYPGSRMTTAGEAWRQVRNNWIVPYGGALFLIMLGALAIVFFTRGPLRLRESETGRKIERFTPFERSAHWANAIAFCILAISGLVMAFGKFLLLPVLGLTLFGWLTYVLKNLHNFAGPVFAVSLVIIFLTFLRDNWPQRGDLRWLLKIGGFFNKDHIEPPSNRFNAGEKVVFWGGVFLLGIIVVGFGTGDGQADSQPGVRARHHADHQHGPRRGRGPDDDGVRAAHLPGHHRHDRRLQGHAHRLRGRDLGPRAPRVLVRGHPGRQNPGAAQPAAGPGRGCRNRQAGMTQQQEHKRMKQVLLSGVLAVAAGLAWAKLPPPDDAAKAKAAEAAAKAAWQAKVDAYQLCKAQDKVAAQYKKTASGSAAKPADKTATPAAMPASAASHAASGTPVTAAPPAPCSDPGPFAYNPPEQKPLETSGAHSPAGTAASPPSVKANSAEMAPAKK